MIDINKKSDCGFVGDVVSYLYNEAGSRKRADFESHLINCQPCMDDLAEISFSRFSVYEWHKEDFVPLATPKITIPYPTNLESTVLDVRPGIFAGVIDLMTVTRWPAAIAAVLVLSLGIGFAMKMFSDRNQQWAATSVADEPLPMVQPAEPDTNYAKGLQTLPDVVTEPEVKSDSESSEVQPTRAAVNKNRPGSVKALPVRTRNNVRKTTDSLDLRPALTANAAPGLTSYEDSDDGSLRLADLFDDDGS